MRVESEHEFEAPIEAVYAMFRDQASHIAKFEAEGNTNIEVIDEVDGDEYVLTVAQDVTAELPSFAKKMFSPTNRVTSVDTWRDNGDGTYGGGYTVETAGIPIEIVGTTLLRPIDGYPGYTNYTVAVDMEINVPVIGGRLAKWAKGMVEEQMKTQFAAGDAWLAEHA